MNTGEALKKGSAAFAEAGIEEPLTDARVLMGAVLGISSAELMAHQEREVSKDEELLWEGFLTRRLSREPVAYITGRREFMGLDFSVGAGALVPRPDTETLVEEAMLHLHDGMCFMDICTGTGCIALSLLNYSNDTRALATDISDRALGYAEKNAEDMGLADRIRLVRTDLFPEDNVEKYDIIVSNPPYIPSKDIEGLMPEVRESEPREALDGGEDGLFFYRRIISGAVNRLFSGGWLLMEVGAGGSEAVSRLFEGAGFKDLAVVKDLGGVDRVVKGCFY